MNSLTLPRLLALTLLACLTLSSPLAANGLPAAVDGQPLPSLAPMLERTTPAVVNISTIGTTRVANPLFEDPFFRHFFDNPQGSENRQTQSLGSGVIVDADQGLVITNHHVIENAEEILVTLTDGREFVATLIGTDPEADIAAVRIKATDLTALGWAGNSGGALVNLRGELVGINTAIVGPSGGNVGIGFAIPSNLALDLSNQLVSDGEVRRGRFGISLQELTEELQQVFGISRGVVVSGVQTESPAESAGLRRGDVLTEIDGRQVRSVNEVKNAIGLLRVGEQVEVSYVREKKPRVTSISVGESEVTSVSGGRLATHLDGVVFENFVLEDRQVVAISNIRNGSRMHNYGFKRGDIIATVNNVRVLNVTRTDLTIAYA